MSTTGKHAVVSYTDLAAAGSRTCLGIEGEVSVQQLDLPELSDCQDVAVSAGENADFPVQIRQQKEVTCYVVNCPVSAMMSHQVANSLLDHIIGNGAQQLTVLTALRPDSRRTSATPDLMESCFNCKPATDFPSVPEDFQVEDAFLNALLTLLKVEDIPTRVLVARGYRANKGCPSDADGSVQTIAHLQNGLSKLTSLKFSKEKTAKLDYTPDDTIQAAKSSLYM